MTHPLRRIEPTGEPGRFARAYAALATSRVARFISRHISWKLDPLLLRWTGGRLATTLVFPTAVLETRGAKSGETRAQRDHLLPRRRPGRGRRVERRRLEEPELVPQPPGEPRCGLRRRRDARDGRDRRGGAGALVVARRSGLPGVRDLPARRGGHGTDDPDRPTRPDGVSRPVSDGSDGSAHRLTSGCHRRRRPTGAAASSRGGPGGTVGT